MGTAATLQQLGQDSGIPSSSDAADALGVGPGGQWNPTTLANQAGISPTALSQFQSLMSQADSGNAQAAFEAAAAAITAIAVTAGASASTLGLADLALGAVAGLTAIWPAKEVPDECASGGPGLSTVWTAQAMIGDDPGNANAADWGSSAPTDFENFCYGALRALYPPDGATVNECVQPIDVWGTQTPSMLVATFTACVVAWNNTHGVVAGLPGQTTVSQGQIVTRAGLNRSFSSGGAPITFAGPLHRDPISWVFEAIAEATGNNGPADSAGQHPTGATISVTVNSGPYVAPVSPLIAALAGHTDLRGRAMLAPPSSSNPWGWVLGGLALAIAAGGGAWLWIRHRGRQA